MTRMYSKICSRLMMIWLQEARLPIKVWECCSQIQRALSSSMEMSTPMCSMNMRHQTLVIISSALNWLRWPSKAPKERSRQVLLLTQSSIEVSDIKDLCSLLFMSLTIMFLDRRKRVEREAGIFDQSEKSLVGGQTEYGNMHTKVHQDNYESAVNKG